MNINTIWSLWLKRLWQSVVSLCFLFSFFNFLFYIGAQLINNVVTVSGEPQRDSAIYVSHLVLWFWFAFTSCLMMLGIFSCIHCLFAYLLWRNICFDPLPIFMLGLLSFYYWIARVLYVFWIQAFVRDMLSAYFILLCGWSFHFLDGIICSTV